MRTTASFLRFVIHFRNVDPAKARIASDLQDALRLLRKARRCCRNRYPHGDDRPIRDEINAFLREPGRKP